MTRSELKLNSLATVPILIVHEERSVLLVKVRQRMIWCPMWITRSINFACELRIVEDVDYENAIIKVVFNEAFLDEYFTIELTYGDWEDQDTQAQLVVTVTLVWLEDAVLTSPEDYADFVANFDSVNSPLRLHRPIGSHMLVHA